MTFRVGLVGAEQILLEEIANPAMKQADIILTYALALNTPEPTDWRKVNEAIIQRWSISGLRRIKDAAWSKSA